MIKEKRKNTERRTKERVKRNMYIGCSMYKRGELTENRKSERMKTRSRGSTEKTERTKDNRGNEKIEEENKKREQEYHKILIKKDV